MAEKAHKGKGYWLKKYKLLGVRNQPPKLTFSKAEANFPEEKVKM